MTTETHLPAKPQRVTLSQQAQHYLRSLIESGTYRPGDRLPSQGELAAQLGISRLTLREALLGLEQEGVIVLRHGIGTFVASDYGHPLVSGLERLESILELATRQALQVRCEALQVQELPAGSEMADALQVAADTPLASVRRVIAVDGVPVAYMVDNVPSSLLSPADLGDCFAGSVLELLRGRPDLRLGHAVSNITAVSAGHELTALLQVPPEQALLLLEETLYAEDGQPIDYSRNYFVPEFFRFHVVRR